MHCYSQFLRYRLNDILECVLSQFGMQTPEFSNAPTENGEFTGEVIFHLSLIESVGCGGRTKFNGGIWLST